MNQEKIGLFIKKLRKEKNMTQNELAKKVGVTDRAVGNWENGRRMPDYTILKDLCDTLEITINELLIGERIKNDDYLENAERNLIDLRRQIEKKQRIFLILESIVLFLCVGMFLINMILNYIYQDNWNRAQFTCYSNALFIIGCFLYVVIAVLQFDRK